ncbi:MAG TPA: hypothetical protein VEJ16_13190 [Alphaproteobacteria bacterium]|nr:hypothetical protein [Alphaproteobacteria bacterium]
MRALKALVIVMGVLIIAGIALVGYTIVKRATSPETAARPEASVSAQSGAVSPIKGPYGPISIELPPGARIVRTMTADRRLVVEVELVSGGERVLVVDLTNGALVGTIELKPRP